jgi:hypothetical protein
MSLRNTIITKWDISKLIDRYNSASLFERVSIRQEPLFRALTKNDIIVNITDEEGDSSYKELYNRIEIGTLESDLAEYGVTSEHYEIKITKSEYGTYKLYWQKSDLSKIISVTNGVVTSIHY